MSNEAVAATGQSAPFDPSLARMAMRTLNVGLAFNRHASNGAHMRFNLVGKPNPSSTHADTLSLCSQIGFFPAMPLDDQLRAVDEVVRGIASRNYADAVRWLQEQTAVDDQVGLIMGAQLTPGGHASVQAAVEKHAALQRVLGQVPDQDLIDALSDRGAVVACVSEDRWVKEALKPYSDHAAEAAELGWKPGDPVPDGSYEVPDDLQAAIARGAFALWRDSIQEHAQADVLNSANQFSPPGEMIDDRLTEEGRARELARLQATAMMRER